MESMESRLNSALSRAERVVEKKQYRERYEKRRKRVHDRRVLQEFERKFYVLSTIDDRSERAKRNLELRLRDRQYKARGNIERAYCISRHVRAARLLQKVVRSKLGLDYQDHSTQLSQDTAASRLQKFWRICLVVQRLRQNDNSPNPIICLSFMLTNLGLSSKEKMTIDKPFDELAVEMKRTPMLKSAHFFLDLFRPLLQCISFQKMKHSSIVSDLILLSALMIATYPDEVLGDKRSSDICSKLLEKASKRLIYMLQYHVYLKSFNNQERKDNKHFCNIVKGLFSSLLCYFTLFSVWKYADLNEIVSNMCLSVEQSWVIYLTSKEALSFLKLSSWEKSNVELFQCRLHLESELKGAYIVIKRVRSFLDKVLGKEEGFEAMKGAKQSAMRKIETKKLMSLLTTIVEDSRNLPSENILESHCGMKCSKVEMESDREVKKKEKEIPQNLLSNIEIVHKLLLTGSDDFDDLLNRTPNGYNAEIFESARKFMDYWRQKQPVLLSNIDKMNSISLQGVAAITMERSFFDSIEDSLLASKSLKGIHDLILNLCQRMRELVPNRSDLHSYFSDDDVAKCRFIVDAMKLFKKISIIISNDLEAPSRSPSTMEWQQSVEAYLEPDGILSDKCIPFKFETPEAFLVASVAFLLKKVELCHIDKVNFELVRVAPLICEIGHEYELKHFQEKHGYFGSIALVEELNATWE